jgi:catechol 2,3-dioxygenase-like lactoylglutathione lyase family enzyme
MIKGIAAVWLPVTDMQRAVAFYGETLGLPVTEHDGDWSEVDANGVRIGLNGTESPRGDGGALVAFQPDGELEQEVDRLKAPGSSSPSGSPSTRGAGSSPSRTRTATTCSCTRRPLERRLGPARHLPAVTRR